jgi:BlaI family penicillinase repressor
MDAVFAKGEATAAEVHAAVPDAPSYTAIRTLLRILVDKGRLKIRQDGPRYIYAPTERRATAARSAIRRLVDTFFGGSMADAAAAFVEESGARLSDQEITELEKIIKQARKK